MLQVRPHSLDALNQKRPPQELCPGRFHSCLLCSCMGAAGYTSCLPLYHLQLSSSSSRKQSKSSQFPDLSLHMLQKYLRCPCKCFFWRLCHTMQFVVCTKPGQDTSPLLRRDCIWYSTAPISASFVNLPGVPHLKKLSCHSFILSNSLSLHLTLAASTLPPSRSLNRYIMVSIKAGEESRVKPILCEATRRPSHDLLITQDSMPSKQTFFTSLLTFASGKAGRGKRILQSALLGLLKVF